jgi:hypothetical protein
MACNASSRGGHLGACLAEVNVRRRLTANGLERLMLPVKWIKEGRVRCRSEML